MDYFSPVELHGARVALLPIAIEHVAGLAEAGSAPQIWRFMPDDFHAPERMRAFVEDAIAQRKERRAVPFTTLDTADGRIAGSTRYLNVEPVHRRLEIGFTWLAPAVQRSHVNTEAKLLQLWHAFEVLGCRRIEWKTDANNTASRAAILRLGAREEGHFRKHMLYPDGRSRDTVYFSMINDEWPRAKARLEARLGYPVAPRFRTGPERGTENLVGAIPLSRRVEL